MGRFQFGRIERKTETFEKSTYGRGLGDPGNQFPAGSAMGAAKNINLEHPLHQLRPGVPSSLSLSSGWTRFRLPPPEVPDHLLGFRLWD